MISFFKRAAAYVDVMLWGAPRHREREWLWAAGVAVFMCALVLWERLRP
jgi:hypothetical protein